MIENTLIDIINQQLKNGQSVDTLSKDLTKAGWDKSTVDDTIKYVKGNTSTAHAASSGSSPINMSGPKYAGFWIRFLANILDGLILVFPMYIIFYIIAFIISGKDFVQTMVIGSALYYALIIPYTMLVIYLNGKIGGTPGKLILGLRIVNEQGEKIGILKAILRYLGYSISCLIFFIGLLMIAFDSKKQGLHDKIASTYVVHVK